MRNQLAQVLHGPVQGRLSITSMLLRESTSTPDLDPAQRASNMDRIRALRESIESDIVIQGSSPSTADPWHSAQEFRHLWRGLLESDITLTPDAAAALTRSPALNTRAFEVIGEAALNASRHGQARQLKVTVDVEESDRAFLQIDVLNDGTPPRLNAPSGLGSARIQQMGGQSSLGVTDDGWVRSSITLPLPRDI